MIGQPLIQAGADGVVRLYLPGVNLGESLLDFADEPVVIVDDASVLNVRETAPRVVYLSTLQQPPPMARSRGLIVRHRTDAPAPRLATAVDELGHEFVSRADTLTALISRALARERLLAGMGQRLRRTRDRDGGDWPVGAAVSGRDAAPA